MIRTGGRWLLAAAAALALAGGARASLAATCTGDCDGNDRVTVDELITAVNVALGHAAIGSCEALDANRDRAASIEELVQAINRSLTRCTACAERNPFRNAYFGDLHVHTSYSFDARGFDVYTTPEQAYRFARGEPVSLPPLDDSGNGTQTIRLERPLDFAAVTDHSEFLGEVETCTTPGSPTYDSVTCANYRRGGNDAVRPFGLKLTAEVPFRDRLICPGDGEVCASAADTVWRRILDAADDAYDRSEACRFTSFVAYEYSAGTAVSTRHRNVIFRNARVPFPITFFEQPTAQGLWRELRAACLEAGFGCDVLAIPHNSNESNANMFFVEYPDASTIEEERAQAAFRAAIEPLVEIYQHKGDSECMNGLIGTIGAPDELCNFEKRRRPPFEDCANAFGGRGALGTAGNGCVSRLDYVRGVLLAGLQEEERIGVNPYPLGIIASTDTHNGTPGYTREDAFIGHRGTDDDTTEKRLGPGTLTQGGIFYSPGGLAGVWAQENSRDSLFDALRRKEVFGTSGTRIVPRFFGGWNLPADLCTDPQMIEKAYAAAVPMGGVLQPRPADATAPRFLASALQDPGTAERPGVPLQRLQIIKGWIGNGEAHEQVYDVAGDPDNGAGVDESTCIPFGAGWQSLCTVWSDPDFDLRQSAFYYLRVVENPSCRWNTYECNTYPPEQRPSGCASSVMGYVIQERAWTTPIWYRR